MPVIDFRHPLARFALVMAICFAAWFAVYDLWLAPDGRLDEWLALRLAAIVGGAISLAGGEVLVDGRFIGMPGVKGVLVIDECNGLSSLGLFVAFVLAYPGHWRRRLWFVPAGLAAIYVVNAARILALVVIQRHAPQWFDVLHQFGTTSLFYLMIFGLWVLWAWFGGSTERLAPPAGGGMVRRPVPVAAA